MDILLNAREHGDNNRFSTRMIFCVFCIQLFTEGKMFLATDSCHLFAHLLVKLDCIFSFAHAVGLINVLFMKL